MPDRRRVFRDGWPQNGGTVSTRRETHASQEQQRPVRNLFLSSKSLMMTTLPDKSSRNFIPLVNIIGALFQIRDDYLNLSDDYTSTKGLCEDLTEGKFSYPIIHAIRMDPQNLQLINILKQQTESVEIKKHAVKYMEDMGSFEYCKETIKELRSKAISMINTMDGGVDAGMGVQSFVEKLVC